MKVSAAFTITRPTASAWLLHRSPCVVPIPGTLSIEHLRENLAALDIELSAADLESLNAY